MSDPIETADNFSSLIGHIFTGGPSDAVIAILLIVVFTLIFINWWLFKFLREKERRQNDLVDKQVKIIEEHSDKVQKMAENYMASLKDMNDENNENAKEVSQALTEVRLVVNEVKTLVSSTVSMRGNN